MSNFYEMNNEKIMERAKEIVPDLYVKYIEFGLDYIIEYCYEYIDDIMDKIGINSKSACSKNKCSFCCHSEIFLTQLEFDYIKSKLKEHKIKPDKKRSKLQNSTKDFNSLSWANKACPFLSDTNGQGICTIYPIRPIVCRSHNSIEKTPDLCNKELNPGSSVEEGKAIEIDSIIISLLMMSTEKPTLKSIHKIIT